jgi:hypothetical protein
MFAYQIFMVVTPTATVETLLDNSISESARRASALAGGPGATESS